MARRPLLLFVFVFISLNSTAASNYWVAPSGNDHADGTTRETAWASPSRGQPSYVGNAYIKGDPRLQVVSTHGFLPSGKITVSGETRSYSAKTADQFVLVEPFDRGFTEQELVYDASILGGIHLNQVT